MARVTSRTFAMVNSSAMIARHPEVPNAIAIPCLFFSWLCRQHFFALKFARGLQRNTRKKTCKVFLLNSFTDKTSGAS
jgi:hypothetical protein